METASRVQVFTSDICGYCRAAKRLLSARGIAFDDVNVSRVQGAREALVERTGWRTVPGIEVDGELVGGYTELVALDREGGLAHLQSGE